MKEDPRLFKIPEKKGESLTLTDSLTGGYNRVEFNTDTKLEMANAKRYGTILSLIIFDIDFFKVLNEEYGYVITDIVLKEISFLVKASLRKTDILARWSDEEFVILLPKIDCVCGQLVAEKLRRYIADFSFSKTQSITCSFGVTQFQPEDSFDDFINRADEALHCAIQEGRNRIVTK